MPTAFPSGYYIERASKLRVRSKVRVDFLNDGTPLSQQTGLTDWFTYDVTIGALTQGEKDTLVSFIQDNDSTPDITWTLDGVNLTGRFVPKGDDMVDISMQGARYRIAFLYYAKEA